MPSNKVLFLLYCLEKKKRWRRFRKYRGVSLMLDVYPELRELSLEIVWEEELLDKYMKEDLCQAI